MTSPQSNLLVFSYSVAIALQPPSKDHIFLYYSFTYTLSQIFFVDMLLTLTLDSFLKLLLSKLKIGIVQQESSLYPCMLHFCFISSEVLSPSPLSRRTDDPILFAMSLPYLFTTLNGRTFNCRHLKA